MGDWTSDLANYAAGLLDQSADPSTVASDVYTSTAQAMPGATQAAITAQANLIIAQANSVYQADMADPALPGIPIPVIVQNALGMNLTNPGGPTSTSTILLWMVGITAAVIVVAAIHK